MALPRHFASSSTEAVAADCRISALLSRNRGVQAGIPTDHASKRRFLISGPWHEFASSDVRRRQLSIDASAANDECVGPSSERSGTASGCDGCPNQKGGAAGEGRRRIPDLLLIAQRLKDVKHKVLVLSGKGGVGKSTMACQLAFALAADGLRVGLLDADICGPSVPQMLGCAARRCTRARRAGRPSTWTQEAALGGGAGDEMADDDVELGVMSIGFMLPKEDDAVIWRGPRKNGLIKQFLTDVEWGALDYLLVDTPPGTSDEHISLVQYLAKALGPDDGALIVSTPQEVRRAIVLRNSAQFRAQFRAIL